MFPSSPLFKNYTVDTILGTVLRILFMFFSFGLLRGCLELVLVAQSSSDFQISSSQSRLASFSSSALFLFCLSSINAYICSAALKTLMGCSHLTHRCHCNAQRPRTPLSLSGPAALHHKLFLFISIFFYYFYSPSSLLPGIYCPLCHRFEGRILASASDKLWASSLS